MCTFTEIRRKNRTLQKLSEQGLCHENSIRDMAHNAATEYEQYYEGNVGLFYTFPHGLEGLCHEIKLKYFDKKKSV
jgi:hypothetical protein